RAAEELRGAFGAQRHHVCYAIKANSAGPIVRALARSGCGADVVSGGELRLALLCGIGAEHIVYSGVGKTDDELDLAIGSGILSLQVESVEEVSRIAARAMSLGMRARVSLRINPEIDPDELATHAHIATGHDEAKFGIARADLPDALRAVDRAGSSLALVGLGAHVGSQFTRTDEYLASARILFAVARDVGARYALEFVDTGGGFGIDYGAGCTVRPADFVRATCALLSEYGLDALSLHVEPGRSLVASHAVLLSRVIQRKVPRGGARKWLVIDAGMNDLLRPALYQAKHRIEPLDVGAAEGPRSEFRVVGPVCESSDDFGAHELPEASFEAVALLDVGAYGYTMAGRYNGRALAAEVFLSGGRVIAVDARQPAEAWAEERSAVGVSARRP
ncbi:MAG TPA: diaminopimelate decarboxylase, partial [Polyangiaceae bacterium]